MTIGTITYTNHENDVFRMTFTDYDTWSATRRHLRALEGRKLLVVDSDFWGFTGYDSAAKAIEAIAFTVARE